MASIVCPYCLRRVPVGSIKRICSICGHEFKIQTFDHIKMRLGIQIACREEHCDGFYSALKCPFCDFSLPADIAQYDKYLRFAVVAPGGAGKTNFITTMIEEVRKCRGLNFVVKGMNKETNDQQRQWADYIYTRLEPVPGNDPGKFIPMQWCFQDMNKATKKTVPPYSVTMFDGAGEDQTNLDPTICRYIQGSKMIMLLLDPTQLAGVRAQMTDDEIDASGGSLDPVSHNETADFITGIINYLKAACNTPVRQKIDIPVAVVFSKIDAVARLIDSMTVLTPSGHAARGVFIKAEAETIHKEIDSWMDQCGDGLTPLFNANFVSWRYFGVSSFGNLPKERKKLNRPVPLRVLDPLIWNLTLEGIVRTVDY